MLKEKVLKFLKLEGLFESLSGYLETRIELLKIEVKEDVARLMARIFLVLILTFFFSLFVVLISIGAAWYLGSLIGMTGGFMVIAGFYLLLALAVVIFRKEINHKLEKHLVALAQQKSK